MESEKTVVGLRDLLPEQWFAGDRPHVIRMRAYQMARLTREALPEKFPWFATTSAMILLNYGALQYVAAPNLEFVVVGPDDMQYRFNKDGLHRKTTELAHIVVIAPEGSSEDETRFRLDVAAGLVGSTLGRNAVFHLLFENVVDLTSGQFSVASPTLWNPLASEIPEVTPEGLDVLARGLHAIADLEEHVRNRVRLALNWHEQAMRSPAPDQFLKQWIALEALGMDRRDNLRPLNGALAQAYGISVPEARDRFGLGRIFGFRSRIVHRGDRLSTHGLLHAYLEAIFRDVLYQKLTLPHRGFASGVAESSAFNLPAFLYEGS
ncbi:MAG TPA: hypothetical protein VF121_16925 [Thermoanaerobaculia bacterium]|nr:hypothetical protein [Thermoanaerobaculia bacterium]